MRPSYFIFIGHFKTGGGGGGGGLEEGCEHTPATKI